MKFHLNEVLMNGLVLCWIAFLGGPDEGGRASAKPPVLG